METETDSSVDSIQALLLSNPALKRINEKRVRSFNRTCDYDPIDCSFSFLQCNAIIIGLLVRP